jgi:hypothetical protein
MEEIALTDINWYEGMLLAEAHIFDPDEDVYSNFQVHVAVEQTGTIEIHTMNALEPGAACLWALDASRANHAAPFTTLANFPAGEGFKITALFAL